MGVGWKSNADVGTVSFVNGIAPDGGGNVALVATDIPYTGILPSTSTNLGDEADRRARYIGSMPVSDNYTDLEFHYPADGGGVHHAVGNVFQTGTIAMPVGEEIDQGITGSWTAPFGSKVFIIGTSPGAVLTGNPLVAQGVGFVQQNAAGACVSGSSAGGGTIVLRECVFAGPGKAATFSNFFGALTVENCQLASADGFEVSGVAAFARFVGCVGQGMSVGASMFSLLPGSIVAGGMQWSNCSMITSDASDRMISIDLTTTLPGNETGVTTDVGIRAEGNQITSLVTANLGQIFDETGINELDQRVWAKGSLYGIESEMLGQCEFLVDPTTPLAITKTYSNPDVFENVPRSNGGVGLGNEVLLDDVSQRYALITPDEVAEVSVLSGGTYSPDGVGLAATQASTSGSGTGAEFTVTVAGGVVTTIDSIVDPGTGYAATDTITLTIAGEQGGDAAVITVDEILEWYLRLNGPLPEGRSVTWNGSIQTSAGSSIMNGRAEWRQVTGGIPGPWSAVNASTSLRVQANNVPSPFGGEGELTSTASDSHFKITFANANASVDTEILALTLKIK